VAARLLLIEDMGHDRPRALWSRVVDTIHEHTEGATSTWPGDAARCPLIGHLIDDLAAMLLESEPPIGGTLIGRAQVAPGLPTTDLSLPGDTHQRSCRRQASCGLINTGPYDPQ
jgi:hypothetical protein